MTKVFINYAHEDIEAARRLYRQLKSEASIEPWFDKECLLPGMKWRPAIRKAIRDSRFFISLLSTRSTTKRGYVQKELKDALSILEEFPEDQIFLVPARLEECSPPADILKEIQHVDLFPDWDDGFRKILRVFSSVPTESAQSKSASDTGYEYRCAIVDLDIGLTNLREIAQKLN